MNEIQKGEFERVVGTGIFNTTASAIQTTDVRVVALRESQIELLEQIERLSAELQLFISIADNYDFSSAVSRLVTLKKKLYTLTIALNKINERLDLLTPILLQNSQRTAILEGQMSVTL